MKTFKLECAVDLTVIVPDTFITRMREQALAVDTSPFLKQANSESPIDDEEFIKAVLKNGVRASIRNSLAQLMSESGLGVRLAPASVKVLDRDITDVEVKPEVKAPQCDDEELGESVAV